MDNDFTKKQKKTEEIRSIFHFLLKESSFSTDTIRFIRDASMEVLWNGGVIIDGDNCSIETKNKHKCFSDQDMINAFNAGSLESHLRTASQFVKHYK